MRRQCSAVPVCALDSPGDTQNGRRGWMLFQRLISRLTEVPAPTYPSHMWGMLSA